MTPDFSLKSAMAQEGDSFRFTFYCELCGGGHSSGKIAAPSAAEARRIAEQEARPLFNQCHWCGKWICDTHYNEDVMLCTTCAPKKAEQNQNLEAHT